MNAKIIPINAQQIVARTGEAKEFLRQARLEAYNYEVADLAEMAGVTKGTIYAFRSGRTVWPRQSTLFPLLEALGFKLVLIKTR